MPQQMNAQSPSGKAAKLSGAATQLALGHFLMNPVPAAVEPASLCGFGTLRLCVELRVEKHH